MRFMLLIIRVTQRILDNDSGQVISIEHDRKEAKRKSTQNEHCQGNHKQEEVLVVPSTYTIVHPRTVVVKVLHVCVRVCGWKRGKGTGKLNTNKINQHISKHKVIYEWRTKNH